MSKKTLGKLPADAFGMLDLPTVPRDILDGYRALPDLTGTVSDAMDELGIVGAVPAAMLRPNDAKARVVGRALTVRNVAASAPVPDKVKAGVSGLGEIEAHNLAEPGDVLVVQGVDQVSNLGGMSATIGHRQGEIGAIVDGGARDVDHSRAIGLSGLVEERQPDHRQMARRDRRYQQAGRDLRRHRQSRRSRARRRNRRLFHSARAGGRGAAAGAAQRRGGKIARTEDRFRRADCRTDRQAALKIIRRQCRAA